MQKKWQTHIEFCTLKQRMLHMPTRAQHGTKTKLHHGHNYVYKRGSKGMKDRENGTLVKELQFPSSIV